MATKLEQMRLVRKLSRETVAKDLEIHPNTLRAWELEPGKISYTNAVRLADYYNESMDVIFCDVDTTKCCNSRSKVV